MLEFSRLINSILIFQGKCFHELLLTQVISVSSLYFELMLLSWSPIGVGKLIRVHEAESGRVVTYDSSENCSYVLHATMSWCRMKITWNFPLLTSESWLVCHTSQHAKHVRHEKATQPALVKTQSTSIPYNIWSEAWRFQLPALVACELKVPSGRQSWDLNRGCNDWSQSDSSVVIVYDSRLGWPRRTLKNSEVTTLAFRLSVLVLEK